MGSKTFSARTLSIDNTLRSRKGNVCATGYGKICNVSLGFGHRPDIVLGGWGVTSVINIAVRLLLRRVNRVPQYAN